METRVKGRLRIGDPINTHHFEMMRLLELALEHRVECMRGIHRIRRGEDVEKSLPRFVDAALRNDVPGKLSTAIERIQNRNNGAVRVYRLREITLTLQSRRKSQPADGGGRSTRQVLL